jgi:glycerol kinase
MTTRVAVIDQGSTSTKGAVFSLAGEKLAEASVPVERHQEGARVTHDPEALSEGVVGVLRRLTREHRVIAIGLACQRSTCLVWERETGRALTEALSWQDRSQTERVAALAGEAGTVRERTGLRLSAYHAAPKLAALLESLPEGRARAASGELVGGTLDAFLVHRLTGRAATEPGTAGRTLLYDLERGAWSEPLAALWDLPVAMLPELSTSASDWGSFDGIPLLAVAGDQQASLLGHGGWRPGTTAAHFGTGAFVLASTGASVRRHDGLLSAVLASTPRSRQFQIEGSVNSAGSAVDWARALTGIDLESWTERPLEAARPWVLPAFQGLGAPEWRTDASAVVGGLELSTSPESLLSGVLAGVAHRVLDCVEAIDEAGVTIDRLRVSGKLTRLAGLVRLLADAGRIPVEISAEEETGALGLVRLIGAQLEASDEPLARPAPAARRLEPEGSADRAAEERAAEERSRWREFVHAALELGPPQRPRAGRTRRDPAARRARDKEPMASQEAGEELREEP